MVLRYLRHLAANVTPQLEPARQDQVPNHAGGFVFEVDCWKRLDRFLILGCEGPTYYACERQMTRENLGCVRECLDADGVRTVSVLEQVSVSGRAPKNDPAIVALALASSHPDLTVRKAALAALPRVCRTGTHLLHFAQSVEQFRRWGRGLRQAVGQWYEDKSPEALAFQLAKYGQRDGWSHRDLLRLSHPQPRTASHHALYRWVTSGSVEAMQSSSSRGAPGRRELLPGFIEGFEALQAAKSAREVARLVEAHGFTHEMVPGTWKDQPRVWEALLKEMPMTAMIRNLAKMTSVGLIAPLSGATEVVASRLRDETRLRRARVHPLAVLVALRTYEQGKGVRGSLQWQAVPAILEALQDAFYASFGLVEPSGKRVLIALDVSGSMSWGTLSGMPGITPRVGSAAMAMLTMRAERQWHVMGFSNELVDVALTPRMRLEEVIQTVDGIPMGGTDCALPMVVARQRKLPVDLFVVYTDNETWAGSIHPFQALRQYRQAMGVPARLAVVGMTATEFSIADPGDAGMLDMVGFDTAAPAVLADFACN